MSNLRAMSLYHNISRPLFLEVSNLVFVLNNERGVNSFASILLELCHAGIPPLLTKLLVTERVIESVILTVFALRRWWVWFRLFTLLLDTFVLEKNRFSSLLQIFHKFAVVLNIWRAPSLMVIPIAWNSQLFLFHQSVLALPVHSSFLLLYNFVAFLVILRHEVLWLRWPSLLG